MFTALGNFMIRLTAVLTDNKVNKLGTKIRLFHVTLNLLPSTAAEMVDPYPILIFLQLHELHQVVGFKLLVDPADQQADLTCSVALQALYPLQGRRQEQAATCTEEQLGLLPSLG